MSDLKHQTPEQLLETITRAEQYEKHLKKEIYDLEMKCEEICKPYKESISKKKQYLGGNDVKLQWVRKYYDDKTKTEMTLEQIEQAF